MILIENKLELFENVVYKNRLLEYEKQRKKIQEERERLKAEKQKALEEEASEMIKRRRNLALVLGNEETAKAKEEKRVLELRKMNELEEDLMEAVREKARNLTSKACYEDLLINGVKVTFDHLEPGTYRFGLTQKDMDRFFNKIKALAKEENLELIPIVMDDSMIGGHVVSDEANTYNLNNDLHNMIEEKRYEIGKLLYNRFKKGGNL